MNNLNIPNKNKQPKKIRPKTIKKQIENFLVTYHVLSKGLNQARITPKQTILIPILIDINQYKINQPFIFINFSSICHLQYPINNNQSDFHYPPQTKIILILKHNGRKRNRWRDNHNQDIQENKKNIPPLKKDANLLLSCFPTLSLTFLIFKTSPFFSILW